MKTTDQCQLPVLKLSFESFAVFFLMESKNGTIAGNEVTEQYFTLALFILNGVDDFNILSLWIKSLIMRHFKQSNLEVLLFLTFEYSGTNPTELKYELERLI